MIHLGKRLHEERIKKGITLEDVSKATKIRPSFLLALEKGEYGKLPSSAYAYGFVKNYIHFLGLEEEELLALFRREYGGEKEIKVLPEGLSKNEDFPINKIKFGPTVKIVSFLFLILLAYIGFQYRYAVILPPLEILVPKENAVVSSQEVTVEGKTDPNSTVYVNNETASVDKDGNFKKTINVFPGKTKIIIKAVNNFNKTTILERHIEVK